jgi:hypothetical protein
MIVERKVFSLRIVELTIEWRIGVATTSRTLAGSSLPLDKKGKAN